MNKIVHLSLTNKSVPARFDVVQYATNPAITFVFDDYIPSGTASLYIEKPDGTKIYNACTISGNNVTYQPTTQSFAAVGINKGQLQIVEPGGTAVSFVMFIDVSENIIDSAAIESQDEFTALEEALQTVTDYDGRIANLETFTSQGNILGVNNRQGWTILTSGQDLDNMLTVGVYSASGAISPSLLNNPRTDLNAGLYMTVRYVSPTGNLCQEVRYDNKPEAAATYRRTRYGGTWGTWQKGATTRDFGATTYNGRSPDEAITSLPNNAWTSIGSMTLPKGQWEIIAHIRFSQNATGYRALKISSNNASDATGELSVWSNDSANAVDGTYTFLKACGCYNINQDSLTIYIKGFQNSGGALTVAPRVFAIKTRDI